MSELHLNYYQAGQVTQRLTTIADGPDMHWRSIEKYGAAVEKVWDGYGKNIEKYREGIEKYRAGIEKV